MSFLLLLRLIEIELTRARRLIRSRELHACRIAVVRIPARWDPLASWMAAEGGRRRADEARPARPGGEACVGRNCAL
jgi:hypothetical protein